GRGAYPGLPRRISEPASLVRWTSSSSKFGDIMFIKIFKDRADAGRLLASKLSRFANLANVVVVGLPRGGVPVAYEVAHKLNAPLDLLVVRKLGVPGHEELAMGAIASGSVR